MKHHFIPQFLLKAWADTTEDKKIEVFRLDLPHLPSSRRAPEYTGYEDNLYMLTKPEVAGVEQQAVETKFLQRLDSDGARVLQKLNTSGLATLTHEDLSVWVHFIASLLWRAPDIVSRLRTESAGYLKDSLIARPEEYVSLAETSDPPTLAEYVEINHPGYMDNFGMMSLGHLICNREHLEKILRLRWWLWDFSGLDTHLLLADRPCVVTTELEDPDLVIAVPVAPRKAFIATKSDRVASIIEHQHPSDLLMWINERSVMRAQRRVYARDESPRRFIRKLLVEEK